MEKRGKKDNGIGANSGFEEKVWLASVECKNVMLGLSSVKYIPDVLPSITNFAISVLTTLSITTSTMMAELIRQLCNARGRNGTTLTGMKVTLVPGLMSGQIIDNVEPTAAFFRRQA